MTFTGTHSRMARAALGLSNTDLAKHAGVGVNTVSRFELGQDVRMSSVGAIRKALESRGVAFVEEGQPAPCFSVGFQD